MSQQPTSHPPTESDPLLHSRLEQLTHAQRLARMGSWEHDLATGQLTWSDEVVRLLGFDPAEVGNSSETLISLVHPDDLEHLQAERERGLSQEGRYSAEHRIVRPDGKIIHVNERAELITREDGSRIIAGTVQDITERREEEERARRSEALLRIAGRVAKLGGWSLELPSGRVLWSDEVCALHEVPPGTSPRLHEAFEYYAPENRRTFADAAIRCMREGVPFDLELELTTARGRRVWVRSIGEAEYDAQGNICRVHGAIQDIAELKEAQAAQGRFLDILEASLNEIYIFDPQSLRFEYVNHGARHNLGYPADELLAMTPLDLKKDFSEAEFRKMLEPLLRHETDIHVFETTHRRAEGSFYPVEVHLQYVERHGRPVFLAVISDITERLQAEEAARNAATHLQALLDNSPLYISEFDLDGRFLLVSRTVSQFLNRPAEEIVGRSMHEMFPSDVADRILVLCEEIRNYRGPLTIQESYRIGGKDRDFNTVLFPLFDPRGEIASIGAITRDVTDHEEAARDREKLEAQLRQAQKMEAVGRLAGGVAHDFNNMLSVILGYAELALDDLDESNPLRPHILEILEAGRHSADLTRQLLAFARKQTVSPKTIDLNRGIENALKLLGRLIGEDIELVWTPGKGAWPVRIDPAQLDQILANLAVNARDAIGGVGRIVIETSNVELTPDEAWAQPGLQAGAYAMIRFTDSGTGMDNETREQIFEPFFTTKETGKGTGLGLATVYGILKQNQGFVYVESEPGQGATFKIYLPRHLSDEDITDESADPAEPVRGRGTILLVEDEAPLMRLTTRLIEQLGYNVIPANSPEEALRRSSDFGGEIDLLLTDVVMPNMSGRDLWAVLFKRRPGLKCLFMSGYTADIIADHGVLHDGIYFLQKPFTRNTLAEKLREAMAED